MKITLTPNAGERISKQFDIANTLFELGSINVAVIQTNEGLISMTSYMSPTEIRENLYTDYLTEEEETIELENYLKRAKERRNA
jgi:hypothetical protein